MDTTTATGAGLVIMLVALLLALQPAPLDPPEQMAQPPAPAPVMLAIPMEKDGEKFPIENNGETTLPLYGKFREPIDRNVSLALSPKNVFVHTIVVNESFWELESRRIDNAGTIWLDFVAKPSLPGSVHQVAQLKLRPRTGGEPVRIDISNVDIRTPSGEQLKVHVSPGGFQYP